MTEDTPQRTFGSSMEAFEHACAEHDTLIVPEHPMLAMVLESVAEGGLRNEGDGCAELTLKVASEDGGFVVISRTTFAPKQALQPGDLVCWVPLQQDAELAARAPDARFGWVGLVFASFEPEWVEDEWVVREFFE
ncbi:hypothetical protein [Maricaulis salignorans]|uniref:hypothetical protein n=1 Tax=Maricaulis salignorans TaxID=144026 RepID=UPI003A8CA039